MMMLMMLMTIETTPDEDMRAAKEGPPSLPVGPPFNSIGYGMNVPLLGKLSMLLLVLVLGAGTKDVSIVTAGVLGALVHVEYSSSSSCPS